MPRQRGLPQTSIGLRGVGLLVLVVLLAGLSGIAYAASPGQSPAEMQQGGAAAGPEQAQPAGDATVGKSLFTGSTRLQNGGPACRACHSIAGIGALGGGALGPDLTGAFDRFGAAGIMAFPLGVSPMREIYTTKPLTEEEKVHLQSFFQSAPLAQRAPQATGQLALLGVAGAAVLAGIVHLAWRRRIRGVRRPMVTREA